ncbi:Protein CBR-HMG-1.2-like protein [Leptotrombidium deliense]|uniref:Protein CBR-HMG-1.2-like protein n=1 Tax=Leptotrombidium deliense TaxID=299467 RepID=A0A443RVC8_9ACAR|nr:Protein CBR-HMG-1.2-like protein [Leptotrombidium deliense]
MGKSSKKRCKPKGKQRNNRSSTRQKGKVNKRKDPFAIFREEEMKRFRKKYRKQPGRCFQRKLSERWSRLPKLRARYRKKAQKLWIKHKKEIQKLNRRKAGRKPRPSNRKKSQSLWNHKKEMQTLDRLAPFFLFSSKEEPKVRRQHPKWPNKKIHKELEKRWRALPKRVKDGYKKRSDKDRKAHKAMLRKYFPHFR